VAGFGQPHFSDKAMKNYIQRGDVLDYLVPVQSPPVTVNSGDIVEVGDIVGVAIISGTSGDVVTVQTEGVVELPKDSSVVTQGDILYHDGTGQLTTTASTNKRAGLAWQDAATGDDVVQVKLG
jgi:predicted RecA/RadA family phage recombinase